MIIFFISFETLMKSINKVRLALSGGGLRAAAFHLGTIKKLYP